MIVRFWTLFTVLLLLLRKEFVAGVSPWDGMKIYCKAENYRITLQRPGCDPEKVQVSACLGLCASYVQLTGTYPYMINHCKCCKATQTAKKTFTFSRCNQGVDKSIQVDSATECTCQSTSCY